MNREIIKLISLFNHCRYLVKTIILKSKNPCYNTYVDFRR